MKPCISCGALTYATKKGWLKCRECRRKYHAKWREENPDRDLSHRQTHWAKKYGLTWEAVEELYKKQKGMCPIGSHKMDLGGRSYLSACVDHCHKTGKIRGLLCRNHNIGLGNFDDSAEQLQGALDYIVKSRT